MIQYIDKSALVAEIERRIKAIEKIKLNDIAGRNELIYIKGFIDTLEVKEVDLEKEFYDFLDTLIGKDNGHLSEDELFRIAEYFYELGLKAQKGEQDMTQEENISGRRIIDEYWADGEWHYKYKNI